MIATSIIGQYRVRQTSDAPPVPQPFYCVPHVTHLSCTHAAHKKTACNHRFTYPFTLLEKGNGSLILF